VPVDLDAVLAARSPAAPVEATLGGQTIKFCPLTVEALGHVLAGRFDQAFAELVPDPEQRACVNRIPVSSLDGVLLAVYGDALVGKLPG
jgi:hypothetical protein